ncbi:hypothetical protein FRC16_006034 [Serendipita sp. 398]|nr:hypothetical protein FRC16_006034 [Serendipita sp. 398]
MFKVTAATLLGLATFLPTVLGVSEWGQCGGQTYTGSTTCDSGLTCVYSNPWYSQCLRVSSSAAPSSTPRSSTTSTRSSTSSVRSSTSSTRSSTSSTRTSSSSTRTSTSTSAITSSTGACPGATKFKYFGVNESSAEFGQGKYPGILGTDYTWPSPSSVDYFVGKGMNFFRIAFAMERLSPSGLTGSFDATYLQGLKTIVSYVTGKGAYAALDPHNFARFNGAVITDLTAFQAWWTKLANEFKSDSRVIFDVNNEPWGIPATDALAFNQAGINGIRSTGATQLILAEGTSWSGAWTWISSGNGDAFKTISDPLGNTAIEMHQYLDSDGSGTSEVCVSSTIGVERLTAATNWLKQNNLKGFLGELGAGSNDACITAVKGALCHMQQQGGTWIGTSPSTFRHLSVGSANVLKFSPSFSTGQFYRCCMVGCWSMVGNPPSGAAIPRILPEALLPFV